MVCFIPYAAERIVAFRMTEPPRDLSSTGAVVLGLLRTFGPATPYRLKRLVETSVGDFWPLPHAQLYAEPARLAAAGYLDEQREEGGRRRKLYSLTAAGERALDGWLADSEAGMPQFRLEGVLKVFFGSDPAAIAEGQLAHHREWIERLEGIRELELEPGMAAARDLGIELHHLFADFWERRREPGGAG
jgi:PadR family transcriptional regulator, regulatory protein AphA